MLDAARRCTALSRPGLRCPSKPVAYVRAWELKFILWGYVQVRSYKLNANVEGTRRLCGAINDRFKGVWRRRKCMWGYMNGCNRRLRPSIRGGRRVDGTRCECTAVEERCSRSITGRGEGCGAVDFDESAQL